MNIESYLIAFLKKNKYLNLPGIGSFKAKQDKNGDWQVDYNRVSIIDDLLASFIGVNENVSSNNAANAITRYTKELKDKLKAGNEVHIPGLGRLKIKNNGIEYAQESQDSILQPTENKNYKDLNFGSASKPNIQVDLQDAEEAPSIFENNNNISFETETYNPAYDQQMQSEQQAKKEKQAVLTKRLLTTILILAIVGILIWAFYKFLFQDSDSNSVTEVNQVNDVEQVDDNSMEGSMTEDSTQTELTDVSTGDQLKIAIKDYDSQISADKRQKQLESYGWTIGQKAEGSSYTIYVLVSKDQRSTEAIVDSIRTVLNPGGNVHLIN